MMEINFTNVVTQRLCVYVLPKYVGWAAGNNITPGYRLVNQL